VGDDKEKNEFIIIDEDQPKRKRRPRRSYSIVAVSVGLLVLGIIMGAGAMLVISNERVSPTLPLPTLRALPSRTPIPPPAEPPIRSFPTPAPTSTENAWELVFYAEGNLYTASSADKEPRLVVEWAEAPLISPDGTHLAYQRDETDATHLYIARINGSFEQRVDNEEGVYDFAYQWSPDSTMLEYINGLQFNEGTLTNTAALRLVDVESGESQTLVSNNIDFTTVFRWSPDNRQIAFIGADSHLYLVDVQTGDVETFASLTVHNRLLAWSPTGTHLTYADALGETIYVAPVVESPNLNATYNLDQPVTAFAWSPDGNSLAFIQGGAPALLQVVNVNNPTQAPTVFVLPEGELRGGLTWSLFNKVFFMLARCDGNSTGFARIYQTDANTQQVIEVADAGGYNACWSSSAGDTFWSLSPDGTQIAYATGSDSTDGTLTLVDTWNGTTTELMNTFDVYAPVWRP
jgi:Tol biopolymer transport system component